MKITFCLDGKDYFFDDAKMSNVELRLLKLHLGLGPAEINRWEQMILTADNMDAIILMMLIARRRAGEQVEWADFDDLDGEETLRVFLAGLQRAITEHPAKPTSAKPARKARQRAALGGPA